MELLRYVAIIWRWSWLLILGTVLAGGTAFFVSRSQTRIYQATATVLVNQAQAATGPTYQDVLANQQLSKTYANLVPSRPVVGEVAKNLGLPPAEVSGHINASVVRDTQLIKINVQHPNPQTAATIANETAKVFSNQIRDAQGADQVKAEEDLQNQIKAVQESIDQTNAELTRLNGRPPGLPEDQRQNQIAQANSRLDSLRNNLASLQRDLQDLQISVAKSFNSVKLAEPATAPLAPIKPRPKLDALLAGLLGLLAATGVVGVIEYLDDTVKTPDDVTRAVGASTLGAITRFETQRATRLGRRKTVSRLLTSLDGRSPVAEAYRMVRTNLEFARSDRPNQTMLITSSSPEEGKSTTAANLALVLAQTGRRVILVDADLRRPSLHRVFDVPNSTGLSTLFVMDEPAVEGLLRMTPLDNLLLLPSGPLPPNPAELLSSARMERIIALLKDQADLIVFDSPPLLGVADASALAARLDGVLLVVDSGRTRAGALQHAVEVLGRAHARLWGVVLNKLAAGRGSGYYYYYTYRYYSADETRLPRAGAATPSWNLGETGGNGTRQRLPQEEPPPR
jgi:capsular exopolysaccharide synthesis family protein